MSGGRSRARPGSSECRKSEGDYPALLDEEGWEEEEEEEGRGAKEQSCYRGLLVQRGTLRGSVWTRGQNPVQPRGGFNAIVRYTERVKSLKSHNIWSRNHRYDQVEQLWKESPVSVLWSTCRTDVFLRFFMVSRPKGKKTTSWDIFFRLIKSKKEKKKSSMVRERAFIATT